MSHGKQSVATNWQLTERVAHKRELKGAIKKQKKIEQFFDDDLIWMSIFQEKKKENREREQ